MKKLIVLMAGAAVVALAAPASAQVLGGGVGGNVGGGVSVGTGNVGGGLRDTVGSTADMARDVGDNARDLARGTRDEVRGTTGSVSGDASATGEASRDGGSLDLTSNVGADFQSNGGESLGRFVGTTMSDGREWAVIQQADGVYRGVPADQLSSGQNGALTSPMSAYEFRRLPELAPSQGPNDRGTSDNTRTAPTQSENDSVS